MHFIYWIKVIDILEKYPEVELFRLYWIIKVRVSLSHILFINDYIYHLIHSSIYSLETWNMWEQLTESVYVLHLN
jgi:hypothetical protein